MASNSHRSSVLDVLSAFDAEEGPKLITVAGLLFEWQA